MRTAQVEPDDTSSLYDMIVDATGIEYDESQFPGGVEDYKNNLVRHFGRMDANEFDDLPSEISDWANEATKVFNDNRRAKPDERELLPEIEGMPEEEEAEPEPPPRAAGRSRVAVEDDDDTPPPPPQGRRTRVTAAPPDDDDDEPAPPPPRTRATRRGAVQAAPAAPSRRAAAKPATPAAAQGRDPDSGRYAKVMPHYLKDRDIDVPELQKKIEKHDGANYSETTLERTLAACVAVVGWLERNGVNLDRLSK